MYDSRYAGWQLDMLVLFSWMPIWHLILACVALAPGSVCANSHGVIYHSLSMSFSQDPVSDNQVMPCLQEDGELEMEEEPEPAPYAQTLTLDRPW